jgi:hypothetical protein
MSAQQGNESATIGIGGPTSGEAGSTLTHETMAETGGSGVNQQAEDKDQQAAASMNSGRSADSGNRQGTEPEGADTAATAVTRGYQDTRSSQAGKLPTGLGAPETGGNQDERDLAPPRKA